MKKKSVIVKGIKQNPAKKQGFVLYLFKAYF